MATDLITYLRLNSVALIACPIGADRAKVAAVLCSKTRLPGQKCSLITHDYSAADESLRVVDASLVDVMGYTNHDEIMKCHHRLICFDDYQMAKSILDEDEITSLVKVSNNILFFLYSYGIREISMLKFPDVHTWKATFADQGENIPVELHTVNMTERQDLRYRVEMERGVFPVDMSLATYQVAERYCNIVYPLTDPTGKVAHLLKEFGHGEILKDAPKIKELFIILGLHIDQRHLVYTTFDDEYGIVILEAIARLFKYNVFVITNRMFTDEKRAILDSINSTSDPCVIITNTTFRKCERIMNLTHQHFLDSDLDLVPTSIESFYKYANYTISPILTTHIYVANRSDGTGSIETMKYVQLRELLVHLSELWNNMQRSLSIVSNQERRLGVMV